MLCGGVADPPVNAASSGIEPLDVLEGKIVGQCRMESIHGHDHVLPTNGTNLGVLTAAVPNVVVIGQINVQDEFALEWLKGRRQCVGGRREGMFLDGGMGKNGPDINFDGPTLLNGALKVGEITEGLVAEVDFVVGMGILNREGEFAMQEEIHGGLIV